MSDEKEAKQIPANQHPAYIRFVAELQAKGMTVESEMPDDDDIKKTQSVCYLFYAVHDENKWQTDSDYFKETIDAADPTHRCFVKARWSTVCEGRYLLGYTEWKNPE